MSTGVIGRRIQMERLLEHIPKLTESLESGARIDAEVATAITTTGALKHAQIVPSEWTFSDLVYKSAALELEIDGKRVTLGGMCKGSGMINPNMATMLGLLTCDAPVDASVWRQMLSRAMDLSFNRVTSSPITLLDHNRLVLQISVDGDTSTNDTVLALASGKVPMAKISDPSSEAGQKLQEALNALSQVFLSRREREMGNEETCDRLWQSLLRGMAKGQPV